MGQLMSPTMHGIVDPRIDEGGWTMRLALWLRRVLSLPAAGELPMHLEGRLSLGPKKALVLVNCRGKRVLLAVCGDSITPVMEAPGPRRSRKAEAR
jgi:flagellar biogenesis protein FliO